MYVRTIAKREMSLFSNKRHTKLSMCYAKDFEFPLLQFVE